jgi:subtilisin family serine protease
MVCNLLGPPPTLSQCDGSGYQSASGTSMAAPHVAAVLDLMRAHAPGVSHLDLKSALLASTDPLPTLQGVTVSAGRLNAEKALILVPELGADIAMPLAAIVATLVAIPLKESRRRQRS